MSLPNDGSKKQPSSPPKGTRRKIIISENDPEKVEETITKELERTGVVRVRKMWLKKDDVGAGDESKREDPGNDAVKEKSTPSGDAGPVDGILAGNEEQPETAQKGDDDQNTLQDHDHCHKILETLKSILRGDTLPDEEKGPDTDETEDETTASKSDAEEASGETSSTDQDSTEVATNETASNETKSVEQSAKIDPDKLLYGSSSDDVSSGENPEKEGRKESHQSNQMGSSGKKAIPAAVGKSQRASASADKTKKKVVLKDPQGSSSMQALPAPPKPPGEDELLQQAWTRFYERMHKLFPMVAERFDSLPDAMKRTNPRHVMLLYPAVEELGILICLAAYRGYAELAGEIAKEYPFLLKCRLSEELLDQYNKRSSFSRMLPESMPPPDDFCPDCPCDLADVSPEPPFAPAPFPATNLTIGPYYGGYMAIPPPPGSYPHMPMMFPHLPPGITPPPMFMGHMNPGNSNGRQAGGCSSAATNGEDIQIAMVDGELTVTLPSSMFAMNFGNNGEQAGSCPKVPDGAEGTNIAEKKDEVPDDTPEDSDDGSDTLTNKSVPEEDDEKP